MILTSSGQVLTNYHVVQGAGSISVTVAQTGQTYQATVVGINPAEDVALIQLTGASGLTTIKPDTDAVNIGAQVIAVGNAGGTGTLSGNRRDHWTRRLGYPGFRGRNCSRDPGHARDQRQRRRRRLRWPAA